MSSISNIYSVRDNKAQAFGQPFFAPNDAVAYRMIALAARDENSFLHQDPKSFDLYSHGSYDDASGVIESQPPQHITPVQFIIESYMASQSLKSGDDNDA